VFCASPVGIQTPDLPVIPSRLFWLCCTLTMSLVYFSRKRISGKKKMHLIQRCQTTCCLTCARITCSLSKCRNFIALFWTPPGPPQFVGARRQIREWENEWFFNLWPRSTQRFLAIGGTAHSIAADRMASAFDWKCKTGGNLTSDLPNIIPCHKTETIICFDFVGKGTGEVFFPI
jgi:hypothetical protein